MQKSKFAGVEKKCPKIFRRLGGEGLSNEGIEGRGVFAKSLFYAYEKIQDWGRLVFFNGLSAKGGGRIAVPPVPFVCRRWRKGRGKLRRKMLEPLGGLRSKDWSGGEKNNL